jgi:hypothetical protein
VHDPFRGGATGRAGSRTRTATRDDQRDRDSVAFGNRRVADQKTSRRRPKTRLTRDVRTDVLVVVHADLTGATDADASLFAFVE